MLLPEPSHRGLLLSDPTKLALGRRKKARAAPGDFRDLKLGKFRRCSSCRRLIKEACSDCAPKDLTEYAQRRNGDQLRGALGL